ncbi:hypothetical protein FD755_002306 [Muntiacus reevesi]|uniref:Uncharacterized protein n=1 Tax=Muntiacus reevesi TaxID=9886 RepID=A0A5J5N9H6_MUNRE|nr:hypothetical protein FD755_002306 [Muntiacus reevesi]
MSDNEDNFDGDDFDDVEEDEGLDDLENAEEVSTEPWAPLSATQACFVSSGQRDPLIVFLGW